MRARLAIQSCWLLVLLCNTTYMSRQDMAAGLSVADFEQTRCPCGEQGTWYDHPKQERPAMMLTQQFPRSLQPCQLS